ncbi:hypothetical protein BHS30_28540 [Klebsiella pneumoniae]|nr:hypothetical protein BHS30_28540 [Klebsiella pneumoniae]
MRFFYPAYPGLGPITPQNVAARPQQIAECTQPLDSEMVFFRNPQIGERFQGLGAPFRPPDLAKVVFSNFSPIDHPDCPPIREAVALSFRIDCLFQQR